MSVIFKTNARQNSFEQKKKIYLNLNGLNMWNALKSHLFWNTEPISKFQVTTCLKLGCFYLCTLGNCLQSHARSTNVLKLQFL